MNILSIARGLYFRYALNRKRGLANKYPQFKIGYGTYGDPKIQYLGLPCTLEIGSYCSIADDVVFLLGVGHRLDLVTTYPFDLWLQSVKHINHLSTKGDIIIGSDVWIGHGAIIHSGVTIGHGAVIGAGAVVTKDVKPFAIVAGNPAKEIRKRFPDEIISRILKSPWWDLDMKEVESIAPLLMGDDIETSIKEIERVYRHHSPAPINPMAVPG